MDLPAIIKKRRQTLGISQLDLAEMSGVGIATIKNIECGKANPSIQTVESIAMVLGLQLTLTIKKTY
ncbi:MAG: helix-turn-helix transcriptional regulator [Muribaculaceae bacterium]|nr:helix-turn-helix transcriptional regulator [Muribaculaceae bacterium]